MFTQCVIFNVIYIYDIYYICNIMWISIYVQICNHKFVLICSDQTATYDKFNNQTKQWRQLVNSWFCFVVLTRTKSCWDLFLFLVNFKIDLLFIGPLIHLSPPNSSAWKPKFLQEKWYRPCHNCNFDWFKSLAAAFV